MLTVEIMGAEHFNFASLPLYLSKMAVF